MIHEPHTIEGQIELILHEMVSEDQASERYSQLADQLVKLHDLKESTYKRRINPDVALAVAGNLASVLLILNHEKLNVISSRAMSFVRPTS